MTSPQVMQTVFAPIVSVKYRDGEGKRLLFDFLERFLGVEIIGFQASYSLKADLILFRAPETGSTLAVPCDVMLLSHQAALTLIHQKIEASNKSFRVNHA